MLDQDRAVRSKPARDANPDDDVGFDLDQGWELYEEKTPDGKEYKTGKSAGKPMKNVVISSVSGPMSVKVAIPREAFIDMVKRYFEIKGYK